MHLSLIKFTNNFIMYFCYRFMSRICIDICKIFRATRTQDLGVHVLVPGPQAPVLSVQVPVHPVIPVPVQTQSEAAAVVVVVGPATCAGPALPTLPTLPTQWRLWPQPPVAALRRRAAVLPSRPRTYTTLTAGSTQWTVRG